MKKSIAFLVVSCLFTALFAETYLIEFENFSIPSPVEIKNWHITNGGKYVEFRQKGAEIAAEITLPADGRYYLWVRNRSCGENYRKAMFYINGRKTVSLGDAPPKKEQAWVWQRSPFPYALKAGKNEIKAVGNSPYTRFDAMILTNDKNYKPVDLVSGVPELENSKKIAEAKNSKGHAIKLPAANGKGPEVLILAGGRPWMGRWFAEFIRKSGAKVTCVNGPYLDGFSGASIAQHAVDKVQPTPFDGITPAFEQLDKFKCVIFHFIPEENMLKILTKDRIAALQKYVNDGGSLIFTFSTPDIPGLLPCTVGEAFEIGNDTFYADRPDGKSYSVLPEKIHVFRTFKQVTPVEGAEVISMIKDAEGNEYTPLVVRKKVGKGNVTFFNAQILNPQQVKEFSNWAYAGATVAAVVADSAGIKLAPLPGYKQLDTVNAKVELPKNVITPVKEAKRDGNTVTFSNGGKLMIDDKGLPTAYLPDSNEPFFSYKKFPALTTSGPRKYTSSTAEAVDIKEESKTLDLKWKLTGIETIGGTVKLKYASENAAFNWLFTAGKFELDGRICDSFAEKVEIIDAPELISNILYEANLTLPDPLFTRRFACYNFPRGYAEMDMSGAQNTNTERWSVFASGQPFLYVACRDGVFFGHNSEPVATSLSLSRRKGDNAITAIHAAGFGRLPAPLSTDWFWWHYSSGRERQNNDYIAIWQYQRHTLRKAAGLDELPAYPTAEISYKITEEEREKVISEAAKSGFRFIMTQNPESPIDKLPGRAANSKRISKYGVKSYEWSAGSYLQGKDGWVFTEHYEWIAKDKNGDFQRYFAGGGAGYPVIDLNNKEFQKWYCKMIKPLFAAGMGWIYRDMDGTASGTTNFALPSSPNGMKSQIFFYRFFHDNNCRVGIEGENPLVIDQFWFRNDLYTPFQGKEFCFLGTAPWCDLKGILGLDPFLLGMYGSFPRFEIEGNYLGVERISGELERTKKIVDLVKPFNAALDATGMPYIRETEFGTTWISEKGGALCFRHPVKKAMIDLPAGYRIKGISGNILTDVKSDSIYILEKVSE